MMRQYCDGWGRNTFNNGWLAEVKACESDDCDHDFKAASNLNLAILRDLAAKCEADARGDIA